MTLYKQLIKEMYLAHAAAFKDFDDLHQKYQDNQKKLQPKFNQEGMKLKEIMLQYEKRLCGKTERSTLGVYSAGLADKFWSEIRKRYPMIDFVGVTIE